MAKITLDLSAECAARLQLLVAEYNVARGTDLDLAGWVLLHLKELAIQRELSLQVQTLQEQAQASAAAAVQEARGRLLGMM